MKSEYESAFLRFHDAVNLAGSIDTFQFAAHRLANEIGLPFFAYHNTGSNFDFVSNYPDEWVDHYLANDYSSFDPLVKDISNLDTRYWDRDFYKKNQATKKLIGESAEFGLSNGVTIPVPAFGRQVGMTFAGLDLESVKSLQGEGIVYLTKCAMYFDVFYKSMENRRYVLSNILSPKEKECLAWIARGKTFPDIAEITGTSERNISHYSKSIREKLNANTLTHALCIAIQLGEITID